MHYISPVLWQFLEKWLGNSPLFPPEGSAMSVHIDVFFLFLLLVEIVGVTIVTLMVVTFAMLYRKERHPVATQIEGSTLLEATWTLIPLAIFLVCFVWGALLYFRIYDPPTNAMNVYIVGKQWMWKAEHPGGQHEIDALHVPIGRPVQLTMISQDVFHSFSIPAFRIKREVIPGRYSTVWFEATKPGVYHLFCTQYCGTDHSAMIGWVYAMKPEDYRAWTQGSTSGSSLAQNGERLFASLGCHSCHTGQESARGPDLAGLYGSQVRLSDGSYVAANDAYLRRSILTPAAQIVAGHSAIMPTYQGQVSEEGVIELVEFIKSLQSNYRIVQTKTAPELEPGQAGTPGTVPAAPAEPTQPRNRAGAAAQTTPGMVK